MEEKKSNYNYPDTELHLSTYHATHKFKSVRRAIKRGNVTKWGEVIPSRPFNNAKRTDGRKEQVEKERIYANIRHKLQLRQQALAQKSPEGRVE